MYSLFEVCGIEIEYMVVDKSSRSVVCEVEYLLDQLEAEHGNLTTGHKNASGNDSTHGTVEWSNELVAHVAEAKCPEPVAQPALFLEPLKMGVAEVNALLSQHHACLMPGAAHPWMNPATDTKLWPRDDEGIYSEYDRIFGCKTHGWTNLQSVHINLPFAGAKDQDSEFARLHAAIRVVLPLIPALAAASPYLDSRFTGLLDARMDYYRNNSLRIPSMTGELIPERVFTQADYQRDILERIYAETTPLDPKGILHDEWANARAAIARFDRNAIEIRVMDSQESPLADLALADALIEIVRLLCAERFVNLDELKSWDIAPLYHLFFAAVKDAEKAVIDVPGYAKLFGIQSTKKLTFEGLWEHLFELTAKPVFCPVYQHFIDHGPLARRLIQRYGLEPNHKQLTDMVDYMCHCLGANELFV